MNKRILVTKSSLPPKEEYFKKIEKLWETHWLTNSGEFYNEFETKLRQYLNCDNIELYVNGHMSLDIAIKAMGLKGEVITTPFTFASTTHALVMNGLKPVFCDIREDNYTIDVEKVEALITEETSAILAVHVYGQPCDIEALEKICKKHNLKLIFDAAHAFGVTVKEKSIASFGDMSMFSFHATKVFHSIEGGALVYKDEQYRNKLRNLRNFGIDGPESVVLVGLNAKMNEFAAAMGSCNLDYLDENIKKRKELVNHYVELLSHVDGIKMIDYKKNEEENLKDNYAYFPVMIDEEKTGFTRDDVFAELEKNNIFARKYFYPLITDFECYRDDFSTVSLPVAKYVSDRVLTLPIYSDLEREDVKRICDVISGMTKKKTC